MFSDTLAFAEEQDRADPLGRVRGEFEFPRTATGEECIYLCGNSLGLQPKRTRAMLEQELDAWRDHGVEGHFRGTRPWMPYHELLTGFTAALVGAKPIEVVNMNTLTVNLHLMMVSFYQPTSERYKLLIEKPAFPSDRYAAESQVRFHGLDPATALLEIAPRAGENLIRMEDIESVLSREGRQIALVMLPGVQYYSGQAFDMAGITQAAKAQGCSVGFDLAHAAGNMPLDLHDWGVDFAVWCSYKYLNAGPGAVAGCFVHERHAHNTRLPRFAGWWGQHKATRFQMGPNFDPTPGAEGWQLSNPPIFSLVPVLASLQIFHETGMPALRGKSTKLTGYLEYLLEKRLAGQVDILTPRDPAHRGCQLSIRVSQEKLGGRALYEGLNSAGVVCDWREPDVIRLAPTPLYNRFVDVHRCVEILGALLDRAR